MRKEVRFNVIKVNYIKPYIGISTGEKQGYIKDGYVIVNKEEKYPILDFKEGKLLSEPKEEYCAYIIETISIKQRTKEEFKKLLEQLNIDKQIKDKQNEILFLENLKKRLVSKSQDCEKPKTKTKK